MNPKMQKEMSMFNDRVAAGIRKRRELVQKAIEAFSQSPEQRQVVVDGGTPTLKELAPLTDDEKQIVFAIVLKVLNGAGNVN